MLRYVASAGRTVGAIVLSSSSYAASSTATWVAANFSPLATGAKGEGSRRSTCSPEGRTSVVAGRGAGEGRAIVDVEVEMVRVRRAVRFLLGLAEVTSGGEGELKVEDGT